MPTLATLRSSGLWLIGGAFALYLIFSLQAIGEPGLYMDAVNPDYQVVHMMNPQSPTAIYELPGNMVFGRLPVLGGLYHGSYTTYVTLPFYAAMGGTMLSIRLAHMVLGLFVLVAAALLLWETTRSSVVTGITLIALAVDPAFFLLFRTQAYLPLFPAFLLLLALYALYRWPTPRGRFAAGVLLGLATFGYFVYLFALPGILLFIWLDRASDRRVQSFAAALAGFAVGLLPYALGYGLVFGELGFHLGARALHDYVGALHVVSHDSLIQRVTFVIEQTWYVVTGEWEWLTFWAMHYVGIGGIVKAAALLALPLYLMAFHRRPYPGGRAFALVGATLLSFVALAVAFGARLGGHDLSGALVLLYVLAGISMWGILSAAKRGVPVRRAAAAAGIVLCALNAGTALAMTQRLSTHGGAALYSDIISDVPRDVAARGDSSPFVFGDWGGMMPFIYLTHGAVPVFDRAHLADALCTYGSAFVVLLGSDVTATPPAFPSVRATGSIVDHDPHSGFPYEVIPVRPSGPRCGTPRLPVGTHLPAGVDERRFASTSGVYPTVAAMCCFLDRDATFFVRVPAGTRYLTLTVFVPGSAFYGRQQLQIAIGGRRALETPMLRKGVATPIVVRVPDGANGTVKVNVRAAYSYVPEQVGAGPDTNRYSVLLESVVAGSTLSAPPPMVANATPTPLPSGLALPRGIDRSEAGTAVGIYPGDAADCCFIGSRAAFTVRAPNGARWLTLVVYVPNYSAYGQQRLAVRVNGTQALVTGVLENGATTALSVPIPRIAERARALRIEIVPSFTYVPSDMGINGDTRRLSVILTSVSAGT